MSRRTAVTPLAKLDRFIAELAARSSITAACKAAGIGKVTAYDHRRRNEDFARRWSDALEEGTDQLEDEAHRRAMESSDTLLMFLLKARGPEVYRERYAIEHSSEIARPTAAELAENRAVGLDDGLEAALAAVASPRVGRSALARFRRR
jgi:hypothetical protein